MEYTIPITILISVISTAFAIYFGLKSSRKADTKEIEKRTAERVETNMKLDAIIRDMKDIKESVVETRKDVQQLGERLAIVDQKADKAHLRLDYVERELNLSEREDRINENNKQR